MLPATRSPTVLATHGLSVRFGRGTRRAPFVDALTGVDLTCAAGEILAVLGPNGSGKTTLFRTLCGELRPDAGSATVLGATPGEPGLVARLGYQPDGPVPFPQLRARELLRHVGALMRLPRARVTARTEALLDELRLSDVAQRKVRALSTGMQKRLALATALLAEPEILLLDEPTAGLDPFGSRVVLDVLQARAAAGTAVLLASHRLDEVEAVSDRVVLLHHGRKVAEGTLDDLLGTGVRSLDVEAPSDAACAALEATAREHDVHVIGWSVRRRHPYALFRELEEGGR